MDRILVTRRQLGPIHMQVCIDPAAADDEILTVCNTQNPRPSGSTWQSVRRNCGKIPMTKPCPAHPYRLHFLVST
jgi:hypothetical protein